MDAMTETIESLKLQLEQLQELRNNNVLGEPAFDEGKAKIERKILDLVLHAKSDASPAPIPVASRPRPTRLLMAVVGACIVAIAALGYWYTGSPNAAGRGPVANASGAIGNNQPHATDFDQIAAMTERLATRMKEKPDDAEGWAMLARSYSVLGRHPEALVAYEKAVALRKDDSVLLADYADSLAIKNNRKLTGEPMRLVERALKLDPRNIKALAMAGTDAFERKDFRGAVKFWEQAVQTGPADSPIVQQVESSLDEARALAGLGVDIKSVGANVGVAAPSSAFVSGTVTLAPGFRDKVQPGDTVFVFARAVEGSRMPLALVRKQVKDLPFQFTLDDSTAMSPDSKISSTQKVIVGARVSKSGNAKPQPGDLSGQPLPVALGLTGLKLEIKEQVTQ
jgi:cytochrome c-type biogenesis protein CcmH